MYGYVLQRPRVVEQAQGSNDAEATDYSLEYASR